MRQILIWVVENKSLNEVCENTSNNREESQCKLLRVSGGGTSRESRRGAGGTERERDGRREEGRREEWDEDVKDRYYT